MFRASLLVGLIVAGCTAATVPVRATEDTAALIKRQSQEFSDASASGDVKVLARLLDDNVAFMDESGELGTKKDLVTGSSPPTSGVSHTLVQTDFKVRLHGPVAVTTFTDVSTVHFHGQVLHASFRSTEVWLDESGRWRMISSQTIALPIDPPAVTLPASDLDAYAGTYTAGEGYLLTIARNAAGLTGSVNGGPSFPLEAELRDVLFTPGQPRIRRIVVRDSSGAVAGILSRREGHDVVLKRVPSTVPLPTPAAT